MNLNRSQRLTVHSSRLMCSRQTSASFTLLELLVAISVLSLLMVILFQIFNESTRAWAASEKKVDAFREARAALYVMSRDLRAAVVTNNAPLLLNTSYPDAQPDYLTNSLFFVTAQSSKAQDSTDKSDLCAVGYYAAYGGDQSQIGITNSWKIRRWFQGSNQTWTNLIDWSSTADLKKMFYPLPSIAIGGDEVLARNVSNLQFSWITNRADNFTSTSTTLTNPAPVQIQITLDAFNYDTAKKLRTKTDWNDTTSTLYKQNVQHFTTRVTVGGGL